MAFPGMPAIHGCVACLHADPTERLNTRPISRASTRITSSLIVDYAWEFAKSADDPRTIPAPRRCWTRRRTLRVAWALSLGQSSEEPALHCGVVRLPPSGPRRGDICSFKSALSVGDLALMKRLSFCKVMTWRQCGKVGTMSDRRPPPWVWRLR